MLAKNKWNGQLYCVKKLTDKEVTLQRNNGSEFTISKTEFHFSYFCKNNEKTVDD